MRYFCAAAALLMLAPAAAAQTSPLIIDQNRPDHRPPAATETPRVPLPATKPETPKTVTPFTLNAVQISGASIAAARITAATKDFIGKTVDAGGVQAIANAISGAYSHSDIALYTIVVPDQDFAGGVLKVGVVEGYIAHVDLEGDTTGDLDLVKAFAQNLTTERPLRKATLQRYLSLIRDIGGLKADIQLVAGNAPGATVMIVKLDQKIAQFGLNLGNNGNRLLARVQGEADATLFGTLQEGEVTRVSYATSTEPQRLQYVSLTDAEPLGDEGTMMQVGGGYLHTRPLGSTISGEAETLQLLLAHPLIRSFDENLSLSGEIDGLNSINALIGQSLADERIRALRGSASYSLSTDERVFSASATFSQGLDAFGARASSLDEGALDFRKLNFALGLSQLIDPEWIVRVKTAGQLAGERLPISEFYSVGGPDYGRAFPAATITGDDGVAGSAELAWHPKDFPFSSLDGSEIYGFIDGGKTWLLGRGGNPGTHFDLASTGIGVRLAVFKDASLELEGARQLDVPPGLRRSWTFEFGVKADTE